jgi:hypothetical protein
MDEARGARSSAKIRRRHPHVPVRTVALDQSNKWDVLPRVRLSAQGRLAQFRKQG